MMTAAPSTDPRLVIRNSLSLAMRAYRVLCVARLDLAATLRRPMWWTWICVIALFALGFTGHNMPILPSGDSSVGGKQVWVTSEFAIACDAAILGMLIHAFFITILAGLSVIRDEEHQIGEILHATPLTAAEYIWGKFLAVFASLLLVIVAEFALFAAFNLWYPHNDTRQYIGPFALSSYWRPALIFTIPQFLFLGGMAFAIGERTRKPILVFVLPAALLLLSILLLGHHARESHHGPLVENLLMWCDPTGFGWLYNTWVEVDRGADFYNHQHIALDAGFLISRLVLCALGLGAVLFSQVRFAGTLRLTARSGPAVRARRPEPVPAWRSVSAAKAVVFPPLANLRMQARKPNWLSAAWAVAEIEARELWTQPGLYLFIPLIVLFATTSSVGSTGMLGTPLLLTAGTMAAGQFDMLTVFLALILIVYTVESLEREKSCRFWTMRNSLPISTSAMLFGKFLALNCIALAVGVACGLIDLVVLIGQGHVRVDIGPFFLVWGLLGLPTVWLIIAGTMAAYSVTRKRAASYVVGMLALVVYAAVGSDLTWAGNLALMSAVRWSDLSVLEMDRSGLILNRLIALGLTLLYGASAVRFFPRRERDPVRWATSLSGGPVLRAALFLAAFGLPAFAATYLLVQNIHRGQEGSTIKDAQKDYWKKNVNQWRDTVTPGVRDVDLSVDLFPEKRAFDVHGTYVLFNKDSKPLAHIPVTCGFQWKSLRWALNGKAYQPINRAGVSVVSPDQPLRPGESLTLGFSYRAPDPGITRDGTGEMEFVLPSAVVLTSFTTRFVPSIGYDPDIGVDDDNESESPDVSIGGIPEPHKPLFGAPTPFMLHMRVTAPADFAVNCVGDKIDDQVNGARRTTVWRSAHPVSAFNLVGGHWQVRRAPGVAVFYHEDHGTNVSDMLSALSEARRNYSLWYAPYPDRELKLSEFPALAGYAQGFSTNITFGEEMGFLTQTDDDANAAFTVTAHESAHQWWGNMVVPGDAPGGNVISEGMAQFSAAMLLEAVKGDYARKAFLKEIESEYFKERSVDSELPLAWTDGAKAGDQTVTYEKGGWAFYMLAHQMGWANAQCGFQKFIALYRHSEKPPKLSDLTNTLREFAPDKPGFDAAVQQWFYQTGIPEYRLITVHRTQEHNGRWTATAQIKNIASGRAVVNVGAWTEKHGGDAAQWRLEPITLGAGETGSYRYEGAAKPTRIVVDPEVTTLQSNRDTAGRRL